jgi:hypothetical protein
MILTRYQFSAWFSQCNCYFYISPSPPLLSFRNFRRTIVILILILTDLIYPYTWLLKALYLKRDCCLTFTFYCTYIIKAMCRLVNVIKLCEKVVWDHPANQKRLLNWGKRMGRLPSIYCYDIYHFNGNWDNEILHLSTYSNKVSLSVICYRPAPGSNLKISWLYMGSPQ